MIEIYLKTKDDNQNCINQTELTVLPLQALIKNDSSCVVSLKAKSTTGLVWPLHVIGRRDILETKITKVETKTFPTKVTDD